MGFRKLLRSGGVAFHQRLYLLQAFPGFRPLSDRQCGFHVLRFKLRELARLGGALLDFGLAPCQSDAADRELHLPQIELRRERAVGHPLRSVGAVVRRPYRGFRRDLIDHHADGQQHADRSSQTQLVSDAIELDHVVRPSTCDD